MSGPVTEEDAPPVGGAGEPTRPTVEVLEGRGADVGGIPVRRVLPKRAHRTVGAWCFADHFGPVSAVETPMLVGPHPHIGLHTVTWLLAGEVVHHDSLGSEQAIRPGQLNLMTAGHGVAHAEVTPERRAGELHGVQLWVAQPDSTRDGGAAFEHHGELPHTDAGGIEVTVLVGSLAEVTSPARTDTPLVGAELRVRGAGELRLEPGFEHAALVVDGEVTVDGTPIAPGSLAYLGEGRDEVAVGGQGTALLLGGEPFGAEVAMWWNFVARSRGEIEDAYRDWQAADGRFGAVRSELDRIGAPRPNWLPLA